MPSTSPVVLLIDDDVAFADAFSSYASIRGCEVSVATRVKDAKPLLRGATSPDLVVLDLGLPDGNGLELLHLVSSEVHGRLIVVTGDPCADSAQRAQRFPIIDYVVKPLRSELLNTLFRRARDNADSRFAAPEHDQVVRMLPGRSRKIEEVRQRIRRIAPYDDAVLLHGFSGTGKELAAHAIHATSGRKGIFVPVNCGASSPDLLGSHLFGHEKGSFTGAVREHRGYFDQAADGTLFLDEITEMPIDLQPYLLRALESRTITPIGASRAHPVNARVVAACNVDPMEAVAQGKLRADLYYRLAQFPIQMPALHERQEDVMELAERFLAELNRQHGKAGGFSDSAVQVLQRHAWPGNVRELKHVVRRAFIMANGDLIDAPRLEPLAAPEPPDRRNVLHGTLEEIERRAILAALEHNGYNKMLAARQLGISVKTIYNKLDRYRSRS